MKKTILSMMLAGALFAGGTAYAQSQTEGSTGASVQKENVEKGKKDTKGNKAGMRKANRPPFNPFDGVQLTNDQQQRLQALQQGLGPVQLTPEEQAKIKENPNLTPEQKKQLKEEKKAKKLEAKKNYLSGVKEILTPDQYVIFLENVYLYAPQDQGKAVKMSSKSKKHNGDKKGKGQKSATKAKNR